jgi:hypothetical protein
LPSAWLAISFDSAPAKGTAFAGNVAANKEIPINSRAADDMNRMA